MNDLEQLQHNLTNHPPVNDRVVRDLEFMRLKAFDFGEVILANCPPSREPVSYTHLTLPTNREV